MTAGLRVPTVEVRESFLAAMDEFRAEGRGSAGDQSVIGDDLRADRWSAPVDFAAYVRELRAEAEEDRPRPAGHVPSTTLWWVDGAEFIGRLAIRHRLNDRLRISGGHIGYDVRASRRRQGHGSAMLRAGLPIAHRLGIDPALLTVDRDNVASRTLVEHAGGVLDDTGEQLRFWLPTG